MLLNVYNEELSIPRNGFSSPLDFSNLGLGMTPPTSSPVLRRLRHEDSTATLTALSPDDPRIAWREAFRAVRAETERRAAPLCAEDQMVQSMPDASPAKWHRA